MRRYMYGVSDYTFGQVYNGTGPDAKAVDLTSAEKQQAADILDTFKSSSDWVTYSSSAAYKALPFTVMQAVTDVATEKFKESAAQGTPYDGGGGGGAGSRIGQGGGGSGSGSGGTTTTSETPWLLYAAGAALLFFLLKGKKSA